MSSKQNRPRTIANEIQRRFLYLFTIFSLFIGLGIITVVGVRLVHQRQQESITLLDSLDQSVDDGYPDWNKWRKTSSINTSNTYVIVHSKTQGTYYSKGTTHFLQNRQIHLPLFPALFYVPNYGFMYYRSETRLGFKSGIWLSIRSMLTILLSVITTVVAILVGGLIIGDYFITLIANQLTKPLRKLKVAAQEQSQSVNDYVSPLATPANLLEVQQLATSFNKLLQTVNTKNEHEKTFVSNAAHELRTPIAVILGHSKLIQRRGKTHPEIIDSSMEFIIEEATKMQVLVNQLLVLSRIDQSESNPSYINLSNIVFETVEEERTALQQRISVSGDHSAIAYTNAGNIKQILHTLIDNAGKYSPNNSLVRVELRSFDTKILLTVTDSGTSISKENQAHIFDRFYRGDEVRNSHVNGNGLGLSIAKQLANLNHLSLTYSEVEPSQNQFSLTFKNPKKDLD